jgi:hypothetical protein
MIKILMLGRPGGTLGFTFDQHVAALNSDPKKRYQVETVKNETTVQDVKHFDVFWFYAKAFHPSVFNTLREHYPDKTFIVGPNVLLDKPDIGISDDWDNWLINYADFDIHLDQVEFYNNHVKKFLPEKKKAISTYLDKCMILDIFEKDISDIDRDIDCLVYSKKRRYDKNFNDFRANIIKGLNNRGIKYQEITYGKYKKDEFIQKLLRTKVMLNLSLDECPGILNYEAFYCNVHVIGSPHNVPSHYDDRFYVENTDCMTEQYLVRQPKSAEKYLQKLDWYFKDFTSLPASKKSSPREFVLRHTSYSKYCDSVEKIIKRFT